MPAGMVFDIKKFSLHDGPGIRTTVFLKGCSLRCWWCHNPESQHPQPELMLRPELCIGCRACADACPQSAITPDLTTDRALCVHCGVCAEACYADAREIVGREMTVEQVMAEILRDVPFYDQSGGGVTFSGGEPLIQPDFVLALLEACKHHDIHTTLDTCGQVPASTLERAIPYTDLFLYDLKLMDSERHRAVTGAPNTLILDNLRLLAENGAHVVIRVPVIPGINDDEENFRQMGRFVRSLPQIERVDLLAYHHIGQDKYARLGKPNPMPETATPSDARLAELRAMLEQAGFSVTTGG